MDDAVCIICNDPGGQLVNVQTRGIQTLIASSKRRRDNKYKILERMESVLAHKNCTKNYNRESSIQTAAKEFSQKLVEGRRSMKDAVTFDFASLCFFCGDVLNESKHQIKTVKNSGTRDNLIQALEKRDVSDKFNKTLSKRLDVCKDLVAAQARYHASCMSSFYKNYASDQVGRPPSKKTTDFMQFAVDYIERNQSDSQFSLNEMREEFTGDFPEMQAIKLHLNKRYPEQIQFIHHKSDVIILFRHQISKQVWRDWYDNQEKDPKVERKRIVEMAGKIILEDIRKTVYDKKNYIIPKFNEDNIYDNIPETLTDFLDILIRSNKKPKSRNKFKWKKRIASISHSIISHARPRSFLSPILLGLSSMIHKKYASKGLIEALSYLGFCASYDETLLFEASILEEPDTHTCSPEAFIQYIFDNADHNTCTIDGKNTFHSMGGIMAVTPSSTVNSKRTIPRLSKIPSAVAIGKFGFTELKIFRKGTSKGLKAVLIEDIIKDDLPDREMSMEDFCWLYSKFSNKKSKGYSGFFEQFYSNSDYKVSKIIPLPFVNNKPDDYNTVFTILAQAAVEHKLREEKAQPVDQTDPYNKMDVCFVTFDAPLYLKARYILSCVDSNDDPFGLSNIIARLGGFHLLMSFLGSIGFIMDGSGLKEAFSVIYAENSAEKALAGHAYSRAIRGHFLIHIALANIIFDSIELTEEEKATFDDLLSDLGSENFKDNMVKEEFLNIKNKFTEQMKKFEKRGPTSQLWLQYWQMFELVKDFIKAERTGNFDLHVKTIERIIPFFHASAHNNYSKCAHLYLQDMLKLKENMNPHQYERFTTEGFFTIRRTEKFWSGVWTDMTIEQVLMRAMKTQGGLTHGRGMSESVLIKFILTMIILDEVCNEMEDFCDVSYITSEHLII